MQECGLAWLNDYENAPPLKRVKREPPRDDSGNERDTTETTETKEAVKRPLIIEPTKLLYRVDSDRSALLMEFCIENNVYVTRFVNRHTRARFSFNLHTLALSLLGYYVEFSRRKFAKVNLRTLDGGSALIYASGLLVETGSDNTVTSERMLEHTVQILREQCGYANLDVESRVCHNIVATGRVQSPLCLNVLRHRFPAASATRDKFTGVIVRLCDLERHFAQQAYAQGHDGDEYEVVESQVDDDPAVIARINGTQRKPQEQRATEETDDDGEVREVLADAFGVAPEDREPEEQPPEPSRRTPNAGNNGTFLIYEQGQFICAGCKSRRKLMSAHEKLYRLLEQCTATPENVALERELLRGRRRQEGGTT